jgi:hypothetical protein
MGAGADEDLFDINAAVFGFYDKQTGEAAT